MGREDSNKEWLKGRHGWRTATSVPTAKRKAKRKAANKSARRSRRSNR